jgi:RHS repeat-associated protein
MSLQSCCEAGRCNEKVVDLSGNIVAEYSYDAWGSALTAIGELAEVNPIRCRGYYFDTETQLYYCQQRYYNPGWGRWVSHDTLFNVGIVNENNLFVYCLNDPINYSDKIGQSAGRILDAPKSTYIPWELTLWITGLSLAAPYFIEGEAELVSAYMSAQPFEYNGKTYELYRFETTITYVNTVWFTLKYTIVTYAGTVQSWNALCSSVENFNSKGSNLEWLQIFLPLSAGGIIRAITQNSVLGWIIGVIAGVSVKMVKDAFTEFPLKIRREIANQNGEKWYVMNWSVVQDMSTVKGVTQVVMDHFSSLVTLLSSLSKAFVNLYSNNEGRGI